MPELMQPQIRVEPLIGLGPETGVCRRDPSDVIRVGDQFFVWYTKVSDAPGVFQYPSGYSGELWYAMSKDGHHWQEQGLCLRKGGERDWDGHGVFTPGILVADGHYYLFYTAVGNPMSIATPTAIGVAAADSPRGPWRKFARNPILRPSTDPAQFDSFRVDDACLLVRGGEYWLYYKGRQAGHSPKETKWGVAIAKSPMGPYTPLAGESGHQQRARSSGVAAPGRHSCPDRCCWTGEEHDPVRGRRNPFPHRVPHRCSSDGARRLSIGRVHRIAIRARNGVGHRHEERTGSLSGALRLPLPGRQVRARISCYKLLSWP